MLSNVLCTFIIFHFYFHPADIQTVKFELFVSSSGRMDFPQSRNKISCIRPSNYNKYLLVDLSSKDIGMMEYFQMPIIYM